MECCLRECISKQTEVEKMEAVVGGTSVQLSDGVVVEGGPGDSADRPLLVKGARNNRAGVQAEHEYVHKTVPESGNVELGCAHFEHSGRLIDKLVAALPNGRKREFYFDITNFFGVLTAGDLKQIRRGY